MLLRYIIFILCNGTVQILTCWHLCIPAWPQWNVLSNSVYEPHSRPCWFVSPGWVISVQVVQSELWPEEGEDTNCDGDYVSRGFTVKWWWWLSWWLWWWELIQVSYYFSSHVSDGEMRLKDWRKFKTGSVGDLVRKEVGIKMTEVKI